MLLVCQHFTVCIESHACQFTTLSGGTWHILNLLLEVTNFTQKKNIYDTYINVNPTTCMQVDIQIQKYSAAAD